MSRSDELLRAAAGAFADGRSPFSTEWLSEHDVSLNECIDLGDRIAQVLNGYLNSPDVVRKAFPLFTIEDMSPEMREHAFFRFFESQAMASVTRRLRKINEVEHSD